MTFFGVKTCPKCDKVLFEKSLSDKNAFCKYSQNADKSLLNLDFFAYPVSEKFDTIIGNPPYVRYQDILQSTKALLKPFDKLFD